MTYYEKHKEELKDKKRKYYYENRDYILKDAKRYRENHKEQIAKYKKEYAIKNKEKIRKYKHKYNIDHRKELSEKAKDYQRIRRSNDSLHRFKMQIRHLIWLSFNKKGKIKSDKTEKILGCSLEFFIAYILKTFRDRYGYDYNWDEKVHIDHIKPLKNAKEENDILELCNYSNLQLLKAEDNLHKSFNDEWFETNFKEV